MSIPLKAGVANTVPVGLFVDPADGITPYTTAISPKLSINGGAQADPTNDTTHIGGGEHVLVLTAGECVAGNRLSVTVPGLAANYLPDTRNFVVWEANAFDAFFGGTDDLEVDVTKKNGTAVGAGYIATIKVSTNGVKDRYFVQWYNDDASPASTITLPKITVLDNTGTALVTADTAMDSVVATNAAEYDETTNRMRAGDTYRIEVKATIDGSERSFPVLHTADPAAAALDLSPGGTVNTAVVSTTTSFYSSDFEVLNGNFEDDALINRWVLFLSGTQKGTAKLITDYDGAGLFTTEAWAFAPGNGDAFRVVGSYKGA